MAPDPHAIASAADLWALVGEPIERVITKETPSLDDRGRAFIAAAPFAMLATTAADGSVDVSPKGGPGGFAHVLGPTRIVLPEFPGNRRLDGVKNLVERDGIGLIFVIPGISETLRVNGRGRLTRDPELLRTCAVDGKEPWFCVDVAVEQVFSHCGKAFLRSGLWKPESWPDPDAITSPSNTITERSLAESRPEREIRDEIELEFRPILY